MASLPELSRLFAQLALDLRRSTAPSTSSAAADTSKAISSLAASLNSETPNSRVLDAALSLMCFKTPEVIDARIECLVRTIVSVLSSMVSCIVSPFGLIRVGSSMSVKDCDELIQIGVDLVENLEGKSGLSYSLFYAILRAGVSSSSFQMSIQSSSILLGENERTDAKMRTVITKLMRYLPDEISVRSNEIPLRLLLWYLDPLILKHDISEILRETTERPFLCLKEELHARMSWHSIIICFVTSPTIFTEARALLHSWFLLTGLDSILKFQIVLFSSVLDVLSRPMWWGVSMEMGLKFPFSHAYFPNKQRELVSILTGPISRESFLDLVHHIETAEYSSYLDNNSTWSMMMQFPAWFYFAIILAFSGEDTRDSCLSKAIYSVTEGSSQNVKELQKAAAFYLSWVLNPLENACWDLHANCIQETSKSWSTRNRSNCKQEICSQLNTHERNTYRSSKKLRVPKDNDCEKHEAGKNGAFAIGEWLKEFDGSFVDICSKNKSKGQSCVLFSRIPLGILITSNYLDEKGCELLLHYATTGETLESREMNRIRALDGACLVFDLFDVLEDMALRLFDCEDTRTNFIRQMKVKVCSYLLRCVKVLIEDVVKETTMVDLYKTLIKLKHNGGEVFEGCKAFDDVVDDVARRLVKAKEN